jgi:putative ABC transport system substrate-binding protein
MATRRHLLVTLGTAVLARPLALFAQQPAKIRRVGFLGHGARPEPFDSHQYGAFVQGMRDLGYIEGKNLRIEWRFADGKVERLPELAADLVRSNVEVIVSASTATTHALQRATSTIPIVMTSVGSPVGSGFIKSFARPGGNITGMSLQGVTHAKRIEILRSLNPKLARVAFLFNPDNPGNVRGAKAIQNAAQKIGVKVLHFEARNVQQIEEAFAQMARDSVEALQVEQDTHLAQHSHQVAALALKHRLPSIATAQGFAEAGLLLSYGPNLQDISRRAATYVDKILKGANPAELPVEQPHRFDYAVNLKTAKALGIKLPDEIMIRVERFIE